MELKKSIPEMDSIDVLEALIKHYDDKGEYGVQQYEVFTPDQADAIVWRARQIVADFRRSDKVRGAN